MRWDRRSRLDNPQNTEPIQTDDIWTGLHTLWCDQSVQGVWGTGPMDTLKLSFGF